MLDPLSLGIGAGLVFGGYWTRIVAVRVKGRRVKSPEPICGCDHHRSFHDPATGACHGQVYVGRDDDYMIVHRSCTCRRYAGPMPIEEFYSPQLLPPGDGQS